MPKRYTLHLCALLWLLCSQSAYSQGELDVVPVGTERYHVHIATYEDLKHNSFFDKAGLDDVKYYRGDNNFNRYYLGFFDSKEVAEENCKKARKSGFPFAKIISSRGNKIAEKIAAGKKGRKYFQITYDELFLRSVYFEFNSDNLDGPALQLLEEVNTILVNNPTWKVQLSGHSDSVGTPETNVKISKSRVRAVKSKLLEYGIISERIKTRVFGESAPMAKNREKTGEDVPSGRQLNRRVSIGIYNTNGEMVNIKDSLIVPSDAQFGN